MPFFFLLSGIFFGERNLAKRVLRLLIPFIFFFFAAFVIKAILSVLGHHPIQWSQLIEPITGSCPYRVNPPIWFLQALIIQSVIGALVLRIRQKVVIIVVSMLIGVAGYTLGTIYDFNKYYLASSFLAFPFFAGGLLMRTELLTKRKPLLYCTICSLSVILFAITKGDNLVNVSLARVPCGFVPFMTIAFAASYSLLGLCRALDEFKRTGVVLRFYGENSLIVLCTHMMIIFIPEVVALHISSNLISILFVGIFLMIAEIPIILLTNKYLRRIIGKRK